MKLIKLLVAGAMIVGAVATAPNIKISVEESNAAACNEILEECEN